MSGGSWNRFQRKISRRRFVRGAAVLGAAVAGSTVLACGEGSSTQGRSSPTGDQPRNGGILKAIVSTDDPRLDPATIVTNQFNSYLIYDRLIEPDPSGRLGPGLVEEWEVQDETVLTFKLRSGVTFHDGLPFKAEVVAYNLRRHQDPSIASAARSDVQFIDRIETPDVSTVVLRLSQPFSPQLEVLSQAAGLIASRAALEGKSVEDANKAPVGTGPFKLITWEPGVRFSFARHTSYWKSGRPYLDGVEVLIIPEPATQVANLESGNADWIRVNTLEEAERLAAAGFPVSENFTGGYTALRINHKAAPFNDLRARQALAYAINREEVARVLRTGTPTGQGIFGPGFEGTGLYDPEYKSPYGFDPNKAKDLLSQAGLDSLEFEIAQGSSPTYSTPVQLIQQQLKQADIKANIWTAGNQLSLISQRLYSGDYTTMYTGNVPNPAAPYFRVDAGVMTGASRNYEQYSNKEVDRILRESWAEYDPEARAEAYRRVQEILTQDVYVIVTEYLIERVATSKRARGLVYYAGASGGGPLTEVWLA